MQQYFLNEELNVESTYELSKDDSNHIVRIMRKKINDKVYVVFNNEVKYICNIIDNNIDKVLITPYEQVNGSNELPTKITVAIPPLKNDKIEYLIQKLTELGVSNIILFNFICKLSLYIECAHTRVASALTKLLFDSK